MANDICGILRANAYPGRGLILGVGGDGTTGIMVYFIMGRSENSRNRIFAKTDDGFRTEAFDPAKLTDPSLVIYNPLRVIENAAVITNGDQTETIVDHINADRAFRERENRQGVSPQNDSIRKAFHTALMTREFEPDPPIYTPRISGLVRADGGYTLSILKSAEGNPECCCRYFYDYSSARPGLGHFISTYMADGAPPPSYEGEPRQVKMDVSRGLEVFAEEIWDALDANNKVSLYVRETEITTGKFSDLIINKNE